MRLAGLLKVIFGVAALYGPQAGFTGSSTPILASDPLLIIDARLPEGFSTRIELYPVDPETQRFKVRLTKIHRVTERSKERDFAGALLNILARSWGDGAFNLTDLPKENPWECPRGVIWTVKKAEQMRTLCKTSRALERVARFQAKVQSLMNGPE